VRKRKVVQPHECLSGNLIKPKEFLEVDCGHLIGSGMSERRRLAIVNAAERREDPHTVVLRDQRIVAAGEIVQ
jgi:hypothetical protein